MTFDTTPVMLVAPSGAGKSTLCKRVVAERDDVAYPVKLTTRAPRPGEVPGRDYLFATPEEALALLGLGPDARAAWLAAWTAAVSEAERPTLPAPEPDGALLECALVHARIGEPPKIYGVPRAELARIQAAGKRPLFEIDIQGARTLRRTLPEVRWVHILAPTGPELIRRLVARGTDTGAALGTRIANAAGEVLAVREADVVVWNDDLEDGVRQLHAAIEFAAGRVAPLDWMRAAAIAGYLGDVVASGAWRDFLPTEVPA